MKSLLLRTQNYFLQDYDSLALSIKTKTRYLLLTFFLGFIMLSISSVSYLITQTWGPLLANFIASLCLGAALIAIRTGKYILASNLGLSAIMMALLFLGLSNYYFTGLEGSKISELGDPIVHFEFGLIFVGFLSFKRYQSIIFTFIGLLSVIGTYYVVAIRHQLDPFDSEYLIKLFDASTFLLFAGFGSLLSLSLFNTLIKYLETESSKVNSVNKQLETTVKLRTIELEVINVELKEKSAELEKFNQELQIAKLKAEEASVAKEQFLSTMSHEIRTPLNAVIGMTHLLKEEKPRPDQFENLEVLQVSANHLLSLINDILDFSKIESGRIEFEEVAFSPHDIFTDLQKMFLYKAKESNLKLNLQLDESLPNTIIGDSSRLSQIVANLLSNSIKFTEKGDVNLNVLVISNIDKKVMLRISVADSGIGIPKEKLNNIFESFTQASSETTRKYGGTGLGLSIIKKLVEQQNGTISVKSELDQGSTFVVELPFTISLKTIDSKPPKIGTSSVLNGLKILLVEDNPFNQEVVSKILDNWGISTDTCVSGEETMALITSNDYDIVLMDINLPGKNGFEITELIRSLDDQKKKKIPIIAQTAEITSQSIERAKQVGMNDLVPKPIIPNNLFDKILKAIRA